MLYFYSQMGINLKFVTSNNPLSKSEITSFDEREVIIPPISREIEAKVLPSLTTIMPPFIFSTYFKTIFIKIR